MTTKIIVVFYQTEETELWFISGFTTSGERVLDLRLACQWYDDEWNFLLDNQRTGESVCAETAGQDYNVNYDTAEIAYFLRRQINCYFPEYEIITIDRI